MGVSVVGGQSGCGPGDGGGTAETAERVVPAEGAAARRGVAGCGCSTGGGELDCREWLKGGSTSWGGADMPIYGAAVGCKLCTCFIMATTPIRRPSIFELEVGALEGAHGDGAQSPQRRRPRPWPHRLYQQARRRGLLEANAEVRQSRTA